MDSELIEAISRLEKNNKETNFLEEHRFIASCLQIGLKIEDLKQLDYKDVAKILVSLSLEEDSEKTTQQDINSFLM